VAQAKEWPLKLFPLGDARKMKLVSLDETSDSAIEHPDGGFTRPAVSEAWLRLWKLCSDNRPGG
jgi:hypothetical protein